MTSRKTPGFVRYAPLAAYWFGYSFHWFVLLLFLMPGDVVRLVGEENKGAYLGWLSGLSALIPIILPPFIGNWSDRLGKRKPFMFWGLVVNVLGLVVMMFAPSFWIFAAGNVLVQIGNSLSSAPYAGIIPEVVAKEERGTATGVIGFFQLFSWVAGGLAVFALADNSKGRYLAIIAMVIVTTLITLRSFDEPTHKSKSHRIDWTIFFRPEYRDFRWVFFTRALMEMGKYAVQPFLPYYLADVVKKFPLGSFSLPSADLALSLVIMVLAVTGGVTSYFSGRWSDRHGKKPAIYFAGAVTSVASIGFILTHDFPLTVLLAGVFGLGYGVFVSVDWALGTAVLPDENNFARDMGVWHIGMVLPQFFQGPFGSLLDSANRRSENSGYTILFLIAVSLFMLGTIFVRNVKSVR